MKKPKTRRITIVVPESLYNALVAVTVAKNKTVDIAKGGLYKLSDVAREALVQGLMMLKEINEESERRLREAKKDIKKIKVGKGKSQ